jgi:hypothetical protein
MKLLRIILEAFAGTILSALVDVFKDMQAKAAQRDLGAAQQKQADTEAAIEAKREADEIALEPRDRGKTKGRLRNGSF